MEGQRSPAMRRTPWTLIVFGVLGLYVIVVALLNSDRVKVDFLFFSTQTRLLILILLCLGIGFAAGFVFDRWRAGRKSTD
jgi:uncharacterized integral membrane protein